MATYPIINKETGEQKELVLSVHEWTKWCDDNLNGHEIGQIHPLHLWQQMLVNGEINWSQKILDGMKF